MLVDAAITGDRNVIKKEAVKILNYEDFIIEIQRRWNLKASVIPAIIGATGARCELSKLLTDPHHTINELHLPLKPSRHYINHQFNIQKLYVVPKQYIYVFCVDLRTNSDYFPIQH